VPFKKGNISVNKGIPMSEEQKAKISATKTGVKLTGDNLERAKRQAVEIGKATRFTKGMKMPKHIVEKSSKARTKYTAEELKEHKKQWVQNNKEKVLATNRRSKQRNKARVNASNARYRAEKLQRTPAWLSNNDFNEMKQLYTIAKRRSEIEGVQYHVDHIIPLKGKTVSHSDGGATLFDDTIS
jgi:hypothetical protein